MTGSSVSISGIDALLHRCIAAMIVRVYGSHVPHRISGGELILMERVVVGRERFCLGSNPTCADDRAAGPLSI
jgi:hypothetical protein